MAALPTMMVSRPTPTLWWRKPAAVARPRSALTRSAATAVAVLALVGVARLGTARWGAAPDRPPFVSARNWAGAQAPQPGAADAATATAAATATGDGDGDGRRAALTAVTAANADAAAAVAAPATDADAVGECRAASLAYLLAHPKEFYAESGAWALKSALLAIRSALVDRPSAGAVATVAAAPPPPPLVVDVGANKGQNVPMWRAIYGDAAHLVLVEGNPAVATALAADFASKDDSVAVVQRLVGNATREMDFRVPTGQTSAERAAIQTKESVGLFVDQFNYVVRLGVFLRRGGGWAARRVSACRWVGVLCVCFGRSPHHWALLECVSTDCPHLSPLVWPATVPAHEYDCDRFVLPPTPCGAARRNCPWTPSTTS